MAAKSKIAQQDFSGWTFQPVDAAGNPVQPNAQPPSLGQTIVQAAIPKGLQTTAPAAQQANQPPPLPDITTQEPNTFATLNANLARARMANPTVDDYNKVYEDSLAKAQEYWRTISTQLQQQKMELAKSQALQKSAADIDIQKASQLAPLEVQKSVATAVQTKAAEMPLEQEKAQLAEGLTPAQALAQYKLANPDFTGTTAPLIKALPTTESDKTASVLNGYKALTDIHNAYKQQHANAGAAQGLVGGSLLGPLAAVSSPQTIAYNSLIDDTMAPIARSMGDTGAGLTKDVIMNQIRSSLPVIQDSDAVAGQKIFLRKKQYLNELQSQRDLLVGHYDVSSLDHQIATMNSELGEKGTLDQYNPLKAPAAVAAPMDTTNLNRAAAAQNIPQPGQQQQPQQQQPQFGSPIPSMAN